MRRVVDRATSISAKSTKSLVGLCDDSTSSRRATSEVSLINRVLDGAAVITVEAEGAHAHLVHVGTTHDNSSGIAELLNGRRVDRRNEILQDG